VIRVLSHRLRPQPALVAAVREVGLTFAALVELRACFSPLWDSGATPRRRLAETFAAKQGAKRAPAPASTLVGGLRRPGNIAFLAVLAVLVTGWWVVLRPTSFLGGPATFIVVRGTSMLPHFHTGDFVLAEAQPAYHPGEIVVYAVPRGYPGAGQDFIHRIVGGSAARGYVIKGDNNPSPDPWIVPAANIRGLEVVHLAGGGDSLLVLRSPMFVGLLAAILAVTLVLWPPAFLHRMDAGRPRS
jgi:signal peptidase I